MSLYPDDTHDDPWHWLVIHRDDWMVPEYDEETGQHHAFAVAISEAPVEKIALIPQRPGLQPFVLLVPPDARPIVFRTRAAYMINDPSAPIPEHTRFTGFGWQKTINGHNEQCLLAIFDDGSVVLADERNRLP